MSAITEKFGSGGANLTPKGSKSPTLATALRDIADDLAGLQPAAQTAITVGADIAAFTDPPSAAEMGLLRTFVNANKADIAGIHAKLSAVAAGTYTIKTTKA